MLERVLAGPWHASLAPPGGALPPPSPATPHASGTPAPQLLPPPLLLLGPVPGSLPVLASPRTALQIAGEGRVLRCWMVGCRVKK